MKRVYATAEVLALLNIRLHSFNTINLLDEIIIILLFSSTKTCLLLCLYILTANFLAITCDLSKQVQRSFSLKNNIGGPTRTRTWNNSVMSGGL